MWAGCDDRRFVWVGRDACCASCACAWQVTKSDRARARLLRKLGSSDDEPILRPSGRRARQLRRGGAHLSGGNFQVSGGSNTAGNDRR